MIVVVTGVVGIDKKQYLQAVVEAAKAKGRDITLFNVGDMMYAEAPDVAAGRILDISRERLHLLRRSVFKDIISHARTGGDIIVNTHATFRWRHGLFPAFDFDQMRQLNADMYVCLIDGVDALHVRLSERNHVRHTMKDLLAWREEEILATEIMCKGATPDAKFYWLSRGHGRDTVDTFYKLAFEQCRRRCYLSFPMTHVMGEPEVMEEINDFREFMKDEFICFDPADLDEFELPFHAFRAMQAGDEIVEIESLGKKVAFDVKQLMDIEQDIHSQIYARDFALIDQSDMIISFIPAYPDGRAALSSGVERELQHAYETAKEVFVIWKARSNPSVFVTQTATEVFPSAEEAISFFSENGYIKS